MKKVLITGANSYIGISFERFMNSYGDAYQVDTLDMMDPDWQQTDFSPYDVVFHVAGIAHQKETEENAPLYYSVNRDLAVQVAQHAMECSVRQFIFLSSMSVYGKNSGVITPDTQPAPTTNYGRSKWQAEQQLASLASGDFRIAILRPPMVYGPGCKGNFQMIVKLIEKLPFFPAVKNRRSLVFVDNLCSFVKLAIDRELSGTYFPDNQERVATLDIAKAIAAAKGKRVWFSRLLGVCARCAAAMLPMAEKAFGSLVYEGVEQFDYCYCVTDTPCSLKISANS